MNKLYYLLGVIEAAIERDNIQAAYQGVSDFLAACKGVEGWQDTALVRFYVLLALVHQENGLLDLAETSCLSGLSVRPDYAELWLVRSRINTRKAERDMKNYDAERKRK